MQPELKNDLSQLNRRFRPALMSFFLRRLRSHAEAEDMTQEVFVRLARNEVREDTAQAYIFQTAANLLRDRARKAKVRADYQATLGALEQARVETLDPARVLAGRQSIALLNAGLRELPERTRTIFVLFRLENMSRAEIAATFGISVSAVEKHVGRAMAKLSRCMETGE